MPGPVPPRNSVRQIRQNRVLPSACGRDPCLIVMDCHESLVRGLILCTSGGSIHPESVNGHQLSLTQLSLRECSVKQPIFVTGAGRLGVVNGRIYCA